MPLSIALLAGTAGLFRALRLDALKKETQNFAAMPLSDASKSWQERLEAIVELPNKKDAAKYLKAVVVPAFSEVAREFEQLGLKASLSEGERQTSLRVDLGEESDFVYGVRLVGQDVPDYASDGEEIYYRAEVFLAQGGQDYDVLGWSKSTLLNDVIEQYRKHMQFLHRIR